jgi:hypothetical protein
MRARLLLPVVLLAVGCGPGSFDGKVAGYPLEVRDAAFALIRDGNGRTVGLLLGMSDVPNLCELVKANRNPKNATTFAAWLFRNSPDRAPLAPEVGEYSVTTSLLPGAGNHAWASFDKVDSNCTDVIGNDQSNGRSGLIKVTGLRAEPGGSLSGDFDITFGSQNDKVKGAFNAAYCEANISFTTRRNCE